jgi:hypothetical protein
LRQNADCSRDIKTLQGIDEIKVEAGLSCDEPIGLTSSEIQADLEEQLGRDGIRIAENSTNILTAQIVVKRMASCSSFDFYLGTVQMYLTQAVRFERNSAIITSAKTWNSDVKYVDTSLPSWMGDRCKPHLWEIIQKFRDDFRSANRNR